MVHEVLYDMARDEKKRGIEVWRRFQKRRVAI
jgi:hypothetical protein